MLRIKKLDIFILKSFGLLFAGTFFICLFIFMMQFLWKYVDDLVGKGLEVSVLAQFFLYAALTLVPVSLPLAVLLASLITFGNFGERFELIAMKAAGISLMQIMRPLIIMITMVCGMSFFFQNEIGPRCQAKLWTMLISMRQKSPELDIPELKFYDQIDGYNLYVGHKDLETGKLYDVMIYNFANGFDNAQVIRADSGQMVMTADKQHLYLHLYNGEQFDNLQAQSASMTADNVPYRRETFSEKTAIIDFDADFNMIDESFMNSQSNSKGMGALQLAIDSMDVLTDSLSLQVYRNVSGSSFKRMEIVRQQDTLKVAQEINNKLSFDSLYNSKPLQERQRLVTTALNIATTHLSDWNFKSVTVASTLTSLRRHQTAWHEKMTLSLACLIFFFIGAPLGGIIRKGGLGMPVVVSVVIFIFYYIVNNTGYKLARDGQWTPLAGMWLSTVVLAPLGALLTVKSNKDSAALNLDAYKLALRRFLGLREQRHFLRKDVVMDPPCYDTLPLRLQALSADCETYARERKLRRMPNYVGMWLNSHIDTEMEGLNNRLEALLEEMSNTKSPTLLRAMEQYPVMSVHAHVRPFRTYWGNVACGALLPVGLVFYFRIWIFRFRLHRDLQQVVAANAAVAQLINNEFNNKKTYGEN